MKSKIKGQEVVDAVKRYHGYDISMRQAQRALTKLQPRQASSQNGDTGYDDSRIVRQDTQHLHPESPENQPGPSYSGLPGQRWIPENMRPEIIDISQNEPQRSPIPAPQQPHAQSVALAPSLQHPAPAPAPAPAPVPARSHEPTPLSQSTASPNPPQPTFARTAPNQIHITQTKQPAPQTQPHDGGNTHTSQPVFSNFKIEFTCTTCGALNQSFFPNQGNTADGNYLPPHPVPEQAADPRAVGPSQPGPGNNSSNPVGSTTAFEGAPVANTRVIQPPWPAGALEVPIAPAHS
ncbi:hypothetical protein MW887_003012 [Aspergillus wentii]|nr:hypothetical protein MW887_003012 [Aspergillus wentii]